MQLLSQYFYRYVEADPKWAKQLEGEMTRGKHVITFTAISPVGSNGSKLTGSCQMIVYVKDTEPPRSKDCPESFSTNLDVGATKKSVNWKEPIFYDNVKVTTYI